MAYVNQQQGGGWMRALTPKRKSILSSCAGASSDLYLIIRTISRTAIRHFSSESEVPNKGKCSWIIVAKPRLLARSRACSASCIN